jgi:hypothetical protein
MALVERLMGLEEPKIPVHAFFAASQEVINGRLTAAQVKSFLDMDAAAQTEFDTIAATAPSGTTALATAQKSLWLDGIHGIFLLAEGGYSGYSTAAAVRTKLGI